MPTRIRVVGTSGSGKTRLARRLSHRLDLPYLELDALHHRADWQQAPAPEFRGAVKRAIDRFESLHQGWIVDGNYPAVDDLLAAADTIVWLDYPRPLVMRRVVSRTLRRVVLRTTLWHDNREQLASLLSRDPERNIVAWAWTRHQMDRDRYSRASADDPDGRWVRLRDPAETDRWLATLAPRAAPSRRLG